MWIHKTEKNEQLRYKGLGERNQVEQRLGCSLCDIITVMSCQEHYDKNIKKMQTDTAITNKYNF